MGLSICVYCASSSEIDPAFIDVARATGRRLAERGHTLVYGGGSIGLMGEVARAAQEHAGYVVGVIPESLADREIAYHHADELIVTKHMRERKQTMEDRADGFITLPGGFGTLEELAEIITLRLLKYHDKPIVILNAKQFYDPLVTLFEHFYEHGFAKPKVRKLYRIAETVEQAIDAVEAGGT